MRITFPGCSHSDALQADAKPVAAENGKNQANCIFAIFGTYICSNCIDVWHNYPGHGLLRIPLSLHYVIVLYGKTLCFRGFQHTFRYKLFQVVSFVDNGSAKSSDNCPYHSFHKILSPLAGLSKYICVVLQNVPITWYPISHTCNIHLFSI
jgi:hypothetical protein